MLIFFDSLRLALLVINKRWTYPFFGGKEIEVIVMYTWILMSIWSNVPEDHGNAWAEGAPMQPEIAPCQSMSNWWTTL